MKALAILLLTALPAAAQDCRGTPSAQTCIEADGTRTVTRQVGGATTITGTDPAGQRWSQRSDRRGALTATTGRGSDGGQWRWHAQTIGGRTYTHGVDPSGRAFTQVCDRFRCY